MNVNDENARQAAAKAFLESAIAQCAQQFGYQLAAQLVNETIEVIAADGTRIRKLQLCAALSIEPFPGWQPAAQTAAELEKATVADV